MYQRYMWLVLVLTCFGTSGCGEDPPASGSGGNLGLPPIVRILAPADLSAFTPGDTIAFEGEVTDIKDHAVLLDIVWSSDLDGELDRTPADSSGRCRFQTAQLSHGRHTIELLATEREGLVFVLWGSAAGRKAQMIDGRRHLILRAPHPSPLSAHRGFFGCRHFSQINGHLIGLGEPEIDWRLPD